MSAIDSISTIEHEGRSDPTDGCGQADRVRESAQESNCMRSDSRPVLKVAAVAFFRLVAGAKRKHALSHIFHIAGILHDDRDLRLGRRKSRMYTDTSG